MQITKVSFTRKYNLGGYESCDISMEAQIGEKDNPLEVITILSDNIEMEYIALQQKKQPPKEPFKSPMEAANNAQRERETIAKTEKPADPMIKVRSLFPEAIENRLDFTWANQGKEILIKPKEFLGTELFAQVHKTITANKGTYISAGRDSHWTVPI